MILPWLRIQWISDEKGYGLFATQDIPRGTISFVQDGLDIVISNEDISRIGSLLSEYVEKYSYEDYLGNRIISWDLGKYMNHDDNANTLTTGYGFEIAVRDIKAGQEVTDDYRIFSTHHDTAFKIKPGPIENIRPWDEVLIKKWDEESWLALQNIDNVEQPLKAFVNEGILLEVESDKITGYQSVTKSLPLRYKLQTEGFLSEV